LSELADEGRLSVGVLAYFRERQRLRLYEVVVTEFLRSGITKAELARRMGRKPEQITRWLGAPGNWTLDTVSDLLLAISRSELDAALSYPLHAVESQATEPTRAEPDRETKVASDTLLKIRGLSAEQDMSAGFGTLKTRWGGLRQGQWDLPQPEPGSSQRMLGVLDHNAARASRLAASGQQRRRWPLLDGPAMWEAA
jgi:hypothetical protein